MTAPRPKPPAAMPVFGDAYLSDTHHLTLEEHGAYFKLLLIAWRTKDCALPDDDRRLAMMLGVSAKKWAKLKPVVMAFWTLGDDRQWRQKKQSEVRRFVEQKSIKNSEASEERWRRYRAENKGSGASKRISKRTTNRISKRNPSQTQGGIPPCVPPKDEWPIPDDWRPDEFGDGTACRRIVDAWSGDELALQVERFIAHHQAAGSRIQWQAGWKTWVLNSERFAREDARRNGAEPKPRKDFADLVLEEAERRKAEESAE